MAANVSQDVLREFCADLRLFWMQAGGPSLRTLSVRTSRSKSQVGNILNGEIRRPPDWDVVRALVSSFVRYAGEHGRSARLSPPTGLEQYWRPRYAVLEHAFERGRDGVRTAAAEEPATQAPELAQAHLISEHLPGRFTIHDLLRAYAAELTETVDGHAEQRSARHRLLDYHLHTGQTAARLLDPYRGDIHPRPVLSDVWPDEIATVSQALSWFGAEHRSLTSAVELAAAHGFDQHTWQLAWVVGGFLHRRGHWQDHAAVQRVALDAARRAGDPAGEAFALCGLAQAYGQLTRYDESRAGYESALRLYERLGDRAGRAHAHLGLSWILECLDHRDEALAHAKHALEQYRQAGHRAGEARALNAVGWRLSQLGRYRPALRYCEQAIPLLQELADRYALAACWDTLGYAHHHLGDYPEATACYQRAIDPCREASDRYDEAIFLAHLGDTHVAAGHPDRARHVWTRALEILIKLGHRDATMVSGKLRALDDALLV